MHMNAPNETSEQSRSPWVFWIFLSGIVLVGGLRTMSPRTGGT